ncbi:uncharacterized protein LOC131878399 isoform X2 [Tigriopus californicus]|uniref:uncharacterized protein LOC131878399 isoform X2 n=1 Tax=Tigriopus californicus TaxID=6832 RepID=UPI0027DA9011|nr:uncharacterized protein LOC131878399 isoform X2 [Tigriopus californicus]
MSAVEKETEWSYTPVPTLSSVLDNASNTYTGGRHASLIASLGKANGSSSGLGEAATLQLREGSLAGQKVNYLDSGYSEEDTDQQITSCLMQTASGSIYIPGNLPKNLTVDSRLEYRLHHSNHSPPDHTSPAKDLPSHSMSDRNPSLQLSHAETPFLPPPPPSNKRSGDPRKQLKRRDDKIGPPWEKNFIRNCSWKCIAIFFVLLAVILGAVLITVTG